MTDQVTHTYALSVKFMYQCETLQLDRTILAQNLKILMATVSQMPEIKYLITTKLYGFCAN